jgi:DNA-binding NarL/FixJ family response regulator
MDTTDTVIRVILAEDDLFLRAGVERVLASMPGIEVVAAVGDYDSLVAAIDEHPAEIVLTDIRMPPGGQDEGIRVAAQLRETRPETGVIVLSKYDDPPYAVALLDKGSRGRGYLLKERVSDPRQLEAAIREVAKGGSVIDPVVVDNLMRARASARTSLVATLTPREGEVLAEIAKGRNNQAIAESLHLSERAVEKHINSIFAKLGLSGDPTTHHRVRAALLYLAEEGS